MDVIRHNRKAVCSACFRDFGSCSCGKNAEILIDEGMQKILINLNQKGYKTVFSCESHFDGYYHMYIMFAKNYNFPDIPKDFKFVKKHRIIESFIKKRKKKEEFEAEKKKKLSDLLVWSETI